MPVSAMTPMGDPDSMDLEPVSDFRDALFEAIPSCAADVGMLMNGRFISLLTTLAMSILLPPPTARMKLDPNSRIWSSAFWAFSKLASPTVQTSMSYPSM